ncbi:oligoendopeptidase F [Fervidobacterium pennivorans DSM 9078]|uniref:Oligoendopeptidase F n=1 Tax=Fervidobacterium pennivorans (strain DSM 9078 / Ven5) TaxID=771875 RepID=H9UDJ5_FERPD|nr:M3 family oligoendopeptidase [Fervidobacterium pennivorans]AFG35588.1 oligoendopeptidase F [Fervidobacterium pennivorans DSM 9078]
MEWKLERIFANDEAAIENARVHLEEVKRIANEIERETAPQQLAKLIRDFEEHMDEFAKSIQYAWMKYSVDTGSVESQKVLGIIQQLSSELQEQDAIVEVKLASLSDDVLEEIIKLDGNYEHMIKRIIERRKHLLSKDAEQVLALTSVSRRDGIAKIHSRLQSSYTFEMELNGEKKVLTVEEIKALRRSTNGELRKQAMKLFLERFQDDAIVLTEVYNLVVRDYDTESRLRRFPRPISMMNFANEVSDEIVDRLIEVTNEKTEILRRYYDWKSKILGERLTLADIYAPISNKKKEFSFEEAKDIILESYYAFDEKAGSVVESFFKEERIDLYPRKGKVSGAYCIYATTKLPPYVLTNFTNDMYDVMTLAHELGHGLHGSLSRKQTFFNHDTPLTLAELASVFGEFLVFDNLKNKLSKEEKMALIASKIEDIFATTFRQNMFTNFEIRAHDLASKNGYVGWDELNNIYHEELERVFGNVVEIPEWYNNEWASIPHIYETPFYVYAYNFAQCLVIALYQEYLEEGKAFVGKYLELLESGGRYSPEKLLEKVGIDLRKEGFWENAFKFVDGLVEELVAMEKQ